MKYFWKKLKHFKLKIFLLYALLVGIPMGLLCSAGCFELVKALVYGVPFGLFMAIFFSRSQTPKKTYEEQISTDQDLVLNSSFLPVYLNTFGVFLFFSFLYLLSLISPDFDLEMALSTAGVMGFLLLVFTFFYPCQVIIGKRLIVVRKNGFGKRSDRIFDQSQIKKINLSPFGKVRLVFEKKRRFALSKEMQKGFTNLANYEPEKNLKNGKAQKIISWLRHKASMAGEYDLVSERSRLEAIPRRKPSLLFILFAALFGLFFLLVPIFISSQASIIKIDRHKSKISGIFYKDVQNAFWFFDNPVRKMYETQWKTACEQNLDHHCRLISYLRVLEGDQVDALSMVKKSCSHKDPYSCFNIILNQEATVIDIKLAKFQISETCKEIEHRKKDYCRCADDLSLMGDQKCRKLR